MRLGMKFFCNSEQGDSVILVIGLVLHYLRTFSECMEADSDPSLRFGISEKTTARGGLLSRRKFRPNTFSTRPVLFPQLFFQDLAGSSPGEWSI